MTPLRKHASQEDRQRDAAEEALARLVAAAREDGAFRQQVVSLLSLPAAQREPLLRTALHEMRIRGEPVDIRDAFAALISDQAALTTLHLIEGR